MGHGTRNWLVGLVVGVALTGAAGLVAWRIGGGPVAASTAEPAGPPAAAQPAEQPLTGPWVVALQPGHWEISAVPPELSRLRADTGAEWGSIREVDINTAVVDALTPLLEAKGWRVVRVPATVPPGLRVDAFVSIHVDSSTDRSRRGWKLSPPWRSSEASRELSQDLKRSFSASPNLVQDVDGITVNMRGYFAFNNRRFYHAISPYTPAVLIELGFLSNRIDRPLLTGDPRFWAGLIAHGLTTYFDRRERPTLAQLRPLEFSWMAAGPSGATVRSTPAANGTERGRLDPGTTVMPVDVSGDWYEVFMRRRYTTGWVSKGELVPAENPQWPMPGERTSRQG